MTSGEDTRTPLAPGGKNSAPVQWWAYRFYYRLQALWLAVGLVVLAIATRAAPSGPFTVNASEIFATYPSESRAYMEIMTRMSALVFVWIGFFNLFFIRSSAVFMRMLVFFSIVFAYWVALNVGLLDLIADWNPDFTQLQQWLAAAALHMLVSYGFLWLCPLFLPIVLNRKLDRRIIERHFFLPFGFYFLLTFALVGIAAGELRVINYEAAARQSGEIANSLAGDASELSKKILLGVYFLAFVLMSYGWWLDSKSSGASAAALLRAGRPAEGLEAERW
jgi:hypothetical protein